MTESVNNAKRFTETRIGRNCQLTEKIAKFVFLLMTLTMVLPLLLIVGFLFYKAWPALSIDFVLELPKNGMRAGGIWPAFLGTLYLVLISLVIAAPIGVMAAIYLNEYAKENWFTRIINLAVINLAGVPSIVHALFGLGAFVLAAGLGRLRPCRILNSCCHDLTRDYRKHQRGIISGSYVIPSGFVEHGRKPMANNPRHCHAQLHQWDFNRDYSSGISRCWRDSSNHVYRSGFLQSGRKR